MNIEHPTRYIIRILKSPTKYSDLIVVAPSMRYNTMYATIVNVPTNPAYRKDSLQIGDVVIYDTQGSFKEVDPQLRAISYEDLIAKRSES
jgi:phage gp45-like